MKRRPIGIKLATISSILVATGLLMYFMPHDKKIASLHTVFGFLLVLVLLFHIYNNFKPLKNYFSLKKNGIKGSVYMISVISVIFIIAIMVSLDMPVFNSVYTWGNIIRNEKLGKYEVSNDYQLVKFPVNDNDYKFTVELKKGSAFGYPLFAVWMEDTLGNYLKTLYISKSINSSVFGNVKGENGKHGPGIVRRPEALPCWSHSRGIVAADGYFVPLGPASDLDASTGATPTSSFQVIAGAAIDSLESFKVLLELNQAFDWNDYFTRNSFPDDKIYSDNGYVGQPAVVYSVTLTKEKLLHQKYFFLNAVGHSHYSGKTGIIYPLSDSITTALHIADRIILGIEKPVTPKN